MTILATVLVVGGTASAGLTSQGPLDPLIEQAAATTCDPAVSNPIVCENRRAGSPRSEWDVVGAGSPSIVGFATQVSVDAGQRIDFKVRTSATAYRIDIYRTGYYGGDGARRVATVRPSVALPQRQPACATSPRTGLVDCGTWAVSASWLVPATAVSGVYVARLTRTDVRAASHVLFVVRDDSGTSDIVMQTSDTTWQAYNPFGGNNFYYGDTARGRAVKVSYNRPLTTRAVESGRDSYFASEYAMVQFLEANGYDVSYISGLDTDRRGSLLTNHRVFMSVGHDEYWSGRQRANVEAARDAGVNLAFFSGNEVYWRTRWEAGSGGQPGRTLVCYKETWDDAKTDPSSEWTGTWRDPRFASPADGAGLPENALTGTAYKSNTGNFALRVHQQYGALRFWRGTSVASQPRGGRVALAPNTVGYEFDEDLDNGVRPPGLIRLSSTTVPVQEYLTDYGKVVLPARATHAMTLYRARSGALVFGAGTIQWSWGLGMEHDGETSPPSRPMQQATINLLADMGATATTVLRGLVRARMTSDTTRPRVSIDSPESGSSVNGPTLTISGRATDVGGVVAAVEASIDGGRTWHPARGQATWRIRINPARRGAVTVLARAIDDSANIGSTDRIDVTAECPCSFFSNQRPDVITTGDLGGSGRPGVELGLRFSSAIPAYLVAIRFFQGPGNTGVHVGRVWSSAGALLATVVFPDSSPTGWRQVRLDRPIPLVAGRRYVVTYYAPNRGYPLEVGAFDAGSVTRSPITAYAGVYRYGAGGVFPTASFAGSNYFVDPVVDRRA